MRLPHRSLQLATAALLIAGLAACASTHPTAKAPTATMPAPTSSVAAKPTVLSVQNFRTGGQNVPLPITQDSQGIVCVNYVANASMSANAHVVVELKSFCQPGRPIKIESKNGGPEKTGIGLPELLSIETFSSGPLSVQLPTTRDARGVACKGYVSSTTRTPGGDLSIKTSQYCAPATRNTKGEQTFAPQGLEGIQTVANGDLRSQRLILAK